jgi:ABC-2 type transport system permease protein
MWAFVVISMGPMLAVKGYIISLLSGSIIPIWFFPERLQKILSFLPFQYIYQLPLGIYIGKYDGNTLLFQMGVQVVWIIILSGVFVMLHNITSKKVMVQGG